MRETLRRIGHFLRRGRSERDLGEEMRFHRAMSQRDLEADGVDRIEAGFAARRTFGSGALAADRARDVWMPPALQDLSGDLRSAVRLLTRDRGFTAVAALTLALGIGANATLFTIVNGMGRGPRLDDPDRVVSLGSQDATGHELGVSYLDFADWRRSSSSFAGVAAYRGGSMNVSDPGMAADRLSGAYISAATFHLVGERPMLGRDFIADDDRPGAASVAIIAGAVWKTRYGGDPAIIGRTITVNGERATVVGVMRDGFRFPLVHDIWRPLAAAPNVATERRDVRTLQVFGRLADHVGAEQAREELSSIASRLSASYPDTNAAIRPTIRPFLGGFDLTNPWNAMRGAVALLLLIACAIVATLLLARAAHRGGEIALRSALGATRWRIVRQLLIENMLLATIAGALGLGVAFVGVRLWVASMPVANWPYWYRFTIDWRAVAFLAEVSLGCAVLFGMAPALHLSKCDPGAGVRHAVRGGSAAGIARNWTITLLAAEFALTLALLAGAGLLTRTLLAVYHADRIVDTSNIVLASLSPPATKYDTPGKRLAFYQHVEDRLAGIPIIAAATIAGALPFYSAPERTVELNGRSRPDVPAVQTASYVTVGDRYFETLGLRLLAGRPFTSLDGTPGHEAAIVNQRFAAMYVGASDPIGQRIRLADPNNPAAPAPWTTIVGISPTVRQHYAQEFDPVVYVPYRADPGVFAMTAIARSRVDAAALTPILREQIRALDPNLPLFNIMPLDQLLSGTRFANQVFATMFAVSAAIALLLAAVGLQAITAYAVHQRTQEIGVRMALGATRSELVWLFVRRMLLPLALGVAVGLPAAFGVGRFVRGMVIQVGPNDPVTLVSITIVLIAVALAATFVPARRAARLDPAVALRHE
jgi:putative ABC transport system permease protein